MFHALMHHPVMNGLRTACSSDAAKLVLRIGLGAIFMYHGWVKLTGLPGTAMFFGKIGVPAPELMAPLVAIVEFFGGLFVLLGFAARFWAAGHVIVMIVAILTAKNVMSFKTYEFELMLLLGSLSVFLSGAGAYSLDAMMMKKGAGEHDAAMPAPRA